jgi:F-box protein 3
MLQLALLPDDPLLHILSFLNFKDLTSFGLTCHRFCLLSAYDRLWEKHCRVCWDSSVCPDGIKWKANFRNWYYSFGKYTDIYQQVFRAWKQIETYTKKYCPDIYRSLREGASEADLDAFEQRIGVKLPRDLRCVYRIHDGQNFLNSNGQHTFGVFGTIKFSRYYSSDVLMPLEHMAVVDNSLGLCLVPICCIRTGLQSYLPLQELVPESSCGAFVTPLAPDLDGSCTMSTRGSSFLDFFVSYAQKLGQEQYPSINGEILRFEHDTAAEAVTENIRISVATAFMPMMCRMNPPEFVFAYRITLSMDQGVHPRFACQLETRQWFITDADGNVETVKGPGVVGEYPVVKPGSQYSYISCTSFKTKEGTMHGTYTMRNLATGDTLDAEVPLFRMRCPPLLSLPVQVQ